MNRQERLTAYYSALVEYRRLAAVLEATGEADFSKLNEIRAEVQRLDDLTVRDRMVTAAEAGRRTGYSRAQITRLCRESDQVRCEKRGSVWYLLAEDVDYLRETEEIQQPRQR